MKIFISQPMNGLSDEEILKTREKAISYLKEKYGEDVEIVSSFFTDDEVPENAGRLWYLGRSIQMMDGVDLLYLCNGWQNANGCVVERQVAALYGIKRVYECINRNPKASNKIFIADEF